MVLKLENVHTGEIVKVTPKQVAQMMLQYALDKVFEEDTRLWMFHTEDNFEGTGVSSWGYLPTDKELSQIEDQIAKLLSRVAKVVNYPDHLSPLEKRNLPEGARELDEDYE